MTNYNDGSWPGVWPDFIAPPKYDNPDPRWRDPRLPDFRLIWAVARECGYSIGLHGSMRRDCDMIAAPWTDEAVIAFELIDRLCAALNATIVGPIAGKPHGRLGWILQVDGWVKTIDISVMPRACDRNAAPPPQPVTVQDAAVSDVLAERTRQISAEGWTPEHDDAHEAGELARAAACYAMQAALDNIGTPGLADATRHMVREMWPWSREWWKPADHRRDLVKAGALILAEIQRLDRAAMRAITEGRE